MIETLHRYETDREHKGLSLFDFLDAMAGPIDRKALASATREQLVLLNGEPAGASSTLSVGDIVELAVPSESLKRRPPSDVTLLHLDEQIAVAAKPSGLPFDAGRRGGPNALDSLATLLEGPRRPRPVHRLDKQTSGVVIAGLDSEVQRQLLSEFRQDRARVEYHAVVRGSVPAETGEIDVPLGKRRRSDQRLMPDPDRGTPCVTSWTVLEALRGYTLLKLVPHGAGRSHQVRGHLAAAGHPALCDALYGEDDRLMLSQLKLDYRPKRGRPERPMLFRPAIHAERFIRGDLEVRAPLPDDLDVLQTQLRRRFAVS